MQAVFSKQRTERRYQKVSVDSTLCNTSISMCMCITTTICNCPAGNLNQLVYVAYYIPDTQ